MTLINEFSKPAGDDLSGVTSGEYPTTAGESECVALTPKTDLESYEILQKL